jgi:hypothetical protein
LKALEDKVEEIGSRTGRKYSRPQIKDVSNLKNPFQHGFTKMKLRVDILNFEIDLRDPPFYKMMVSNIG